MHGASFAANAITVSRLARRRKTTAPAASRPTRLQTFLPRSTPKTAILMIRSSLNSRQAYRAGRRGGPFHKTLLAQERDRPDVARRRAQWRLYQGRVDPRRLVFIDETWTKTNMAPLRGWGARGERLKAQTPFGRWTTMTFVAALRCDRLDAPCLFDR